jgi:hypothetical protein
MKSSCVPMDLRPGIQLDPYEIVSVIGKDGDGRGTADAELRSFHSANSVGPDVVPALRIAPAGI